jgi:hypothetical protein
MNFQAASAITLGLLVSGCVSGHVPTLSPPGAGPYAISALGATAIAPTTEVRVGRIYRSGAGAGIRLSDGTILSELCPNDFRDTAALRLVDAGVVVSDAGSAGGSYSQHMSVKPKVGGLGWDLVFGTIGGGYSTDAKIEYSKLANVKPREGSREIILSSIGANCKADIRKHRKAGRLSYILSRGVRTDEATITLTGDFGIDGSTGRSAGRSGENANVSTPSGSIGANNTEVFKQNNVFLGVDLGAPIR